MGGQVSEINMYLFVISVTFTALEKEKKREEDNKRETDNFYFSKQRIMMH